MGAGETLARAGLPGTVSSGDEEADNKQTVSVTTIINGLLALTVNIPSLRTKVGGLMTVGTLG